MVETAGICTSGHRGRTRGHRHSSITRLSLPSVTLSARHIRQSSVWAAWAPAPGGLTLLGVGGHSWPRPGQAGWAGGTKQSTLAQPLITKTYVLDCSIWEGASGPLSLPRGGVLSGANVPDILLGNNPLHSPDSCQGGLLGIHSEPCF